MGKLKVLSLFCGCGGMDLGLIGGFNYLGHHYNNNPFEIVSAFDNDEYCTKIYNANFVCPCEIKDVRNINIKELPQFDILIGGFPCQSFSISAQNPPRLGYKDERGMLFFEMVKILREKQPRVFIAENVKGLLSANDKKAFPMIIKEFEMAGYKVKCKLLLASDFGVPQKRERVIIIGFKEESDYNKFQFPNAVNNKRVLGDVIILEENTNEKLFFSEKAVAGMMAVRDKMNKGRAMNLNEPCNTISSHLAKTSLNSTDPVLLVNGRYRRFSCREAARIQSFPEDFCLSVVSDSKQYKAIGNAVPPVMMWHVAHSLACALELDTASSVKLHKPKTNFPEIDFTELLLKYPDTIVNNTPTTPINKFELGHNLLVSFVKTDNMDQYLDHSARIYYTGKQFPSTIALNKLYYFMPYIKGKGVKDLYLIKIARIGTKKEARPECTDDDLRLVFEIEFIQELFKEYKMIRLNIKRTFVDTTINKMLELI